MHQCLSLRAFFKIFTANAFAYGRTHDFCLKETNKTWETSCNLDSLYVKPQQKDFILISYQLATRRNPQVVFFLNSHLKLRCLPRMYTWITCKSMVSHSSPSSPTYCFWWNLGGQAIREVSLPLSLHPQTDQLADRTTFPFVFRRHVLSQSTCATLLQLHQGLGAVDFFRKYCSSVKDKSKPEFKVATWFKIKLIQPTTKVINFATYVAFYMQTAGRRDNFISIERKIKHYKNTKRQSKSKKLQH